MDKLEKAMEKARRQRATSAPNFEGIIASQASAAAPMNFDTPLSGSGGSEAVTLAEEHLEKHRVLAHKTKSPEADIFRILRTRVLQIMHKSDYRTLAITSPRYGDGKSTIAMNLSVSIALDLKQTVLLVDMDLRKPALAEYLGIDRQHGLTDYLLHNATLPDCMARLPFDRLSVLPGGKPLDHSSEALGSPKMAALANELKSRYHDRLVIYDMPPVLEQDDAIGFLPQVDATLVVVRNGVTRNDDLKRCLERLNHANVIGTVLNN